MSDFKIRSMRINEFNIVAKLVYDSVHTLCTKEYTKEQLDAWVPENLHMPTFRNSIWRCYALVAVDAEGRIIGFMSTERDGYVNRLYTHPERIRTGVATALLRETENWAKSKGIKRLVLEASKSAEIFYEKNGFKKTGTVKNVKNGLEFVSAKMEKELYRNG